MSTYHELVIKGKEGIVLGMEEESMPNPNYIKVAAKVSLVSPGTEQHYVTQCMQNDDLLKPGYCSSGIVEEIGPNVRQFQKGDRVIAMGWQKAIHAQKIYVPQNLCCKIPGEALFEDAVFANLAATAVHAIHRADLQKNDVVLIVGGGLVGQLVALYARLESATVVLSDLMKSRMDAAAKAGLTTVAPGEWQSFFMDRKITKVFLCLTGNADEVFTSLFPLMEGKGNGLHRSKIIGVGRFSAIIDFNVGIGNIDIVYSARCGEGYHDPEYETGMKEVLPVSSEQSVQHNLQYCLDRICKGDIPLDHLKSKKISFTNVLDHYHSCLQDKSILGILLEY